MFGLSPLPRSLEAALRDATDTKTAVRVSAIRDLSGHAANADGRPALDVLRAVLANDVSAEARAAAAVALADAGATSAVDALIAAVEDSHLHVRQMVLLALGELGNSNDAALLAAVERGLSDEAPSIRFQALIASHRLGLGSVERALVEGTLDPDAEVRHVSLRLLEERATTDTLAVRPSDTVRRAVQASLSDPDLGVRLVAAILLGRAGDPAGASVLVDAIGSPKAGLEPEDEQAAIGLVAELRLDAAMPALRKRAWGGFLGRDRFAYEARVALATLGDARARADIIKTLSAFDRDARTLAVVAAGRARIAEARPLVAAMSGNEKRAEPDAVAEALKALDDASARSG